jgi:hypothetical protein
MKQRLLATDLSGPKASEESRTPRRSNLAVVDAVDLQFDFFSSAMALGSVPSLGRRPSGTGSRMVKMPVLSEGTIRDGNGNNRVYIPSGFPLLTSEGVDGER